MPSLRLRPCHVLLTFFMRGTRSEADEWIARARRKYFLIFHTQLLHPPQKKKKTHPAAERERARRPLEKRKMEKRRRSKWKGKTKKILPGICEKKFWERKKLLQKEINRTEGVWGEGGSFDFPPQLMGYYFCEGEKEKLPLVPPVLLSFSIPTPHRSARFSSIFPHFFYVILGFYSSYKEFCYVLCPRCKIVGGPVARELWEWEPWGELGRFGVGFRLSCTMSIKNSI